MWPNRKIKDGTTVLFFSTSYDIDFWMSNVRIRRKLLLERHFSEEAFGFNFDKLTNF